jgi:hypothetical protein
MREEAEQQEETAEEASEVAPISKGEVVALLLAYLMDSDLVLRRLVAEGFTKLACTGKLVDSSVCPFLHTHLIHSNR